MKRPPKSYAPAVICYSDYVRGGKKRRYYKYFLLLHNGETLRCRKYIFIRSGLHLELVHGLTSLRNVDLVVALHLDFSPFDVIPGKPSRFPLENVFSFRNPSLTKVNLAMNGVWRKDRCEMETMAA